MNVASPSIIRSRACTIAGTKPESRVSTILTAATGRTSRSIMRWSANRSCASHTIGTAGKHRLQTGKKRLFLLEKLCSFRSKTSRVVCLSGNDYPGFLTLGQTACTGGTGYPDRLAGRRDASAGTNTRVIDASFSLPPNTEFTCSYVNFDLSDDSTVHKKIFIAYPTEYKVGERVTFLLTPGDSITQDKELFATTHKIKALSGTGKRTKQYQYRLSGRFADLYMTFNTKFGPSNSRPNKKAFPTRDSFFQIALEKDFKNLDPYWQMVFEHSEQYFEGTFVLQFYMYATDKEVWHRKRFARLASSLFRIGQSTYRFCIQHAKAGGR